MLKIMRHTHPDLQFMHLLPYGAVLHDHGTQFVVFSRSATSMKLLLYDDAEDTCLLYTSPSPRDATLSRMPSSA